jgi:hypothetical protein
MPLTSKLTLSVQANYSAALDLVTATAPLLKTYETTLQTGTGAGQADKVFSDTRTLAASGTEDLDLAGVLLDAFGGTITVVKLKAIIISAAVGNTNNVLVGGVAAGVASFLSPAATGIITVRPGATFAVFAGQADAAGYAVTATTADLLHVANSSSGTSVTYDVIMIGTSA